MNAFPFNARNETKTTNTSRMAQEANKRESDNIQFFPYAIGCASEMRFGGHLVVIMMPKTPENCSAHQKSEVNGEHRIHCNG